MTKKIWFAILSVVVATLFYADRAAPKQALKEDGMQATDNTSADIMTRVLHIILKARSAKRGANIDVSGEVRQEFPDAKTLLTVLRQNFNESKVTANGTKYIYFSLRRDDFRKLSIDGFSQNDEARVVFEEKNNDGRLDYPRILVFDQGSI